jgi:TolA-binding protein
MSLAAGAARHGHKSSTKTKRQASHHAWGGSSDDDECEEEEEEVEPPPLTEAQKAAEARMEAVRVRLQKERNAAKELRKARLIDVQHRLTKLQGTFPVLAGKSLNRDQAAQKRDRMRDRLRRDEEEAERMAAAARRMKSMMGNGFSGDPDDAPAGSGSAGAKDPRGHSGPSALGDGQYQMPAKEKIKLRRRYFRFTDSEGQRLRGGSGQAERNTMQGWRDTGWQLDLY